MNVGEVMAEIAAAADVIEGLRCFGYPVSDANPPTFWVDLPERITFDRTYGRGSDDMELHGYVVVNQNLDRTQSAKLAAYMSGSGDLSIKRAIEARKYSSCDDVSVTVAESFQRISVAATEYFGCRFTLVVTGNGA